MLRHRIERLENLIAPKRSAWFLIYIKDSDSAEIQEAHIAAEKKRLGITDTDNMIFLVEFVKSKAPKEGRLWIQ